MPTSSSSSSSSNTNTVTNAGGLAPARPTADSATAAAEERWVRREVPHYEADFTTMAPLTVSCCCFNVGCKKPGSARELQAWLSTKLDAAATADPPYSAEASTHVARDAAAVGRFAEGARAGTPVDVLVVGLQEIDMSVTSLLKEETDAAEPWTALLREVVGADRELPQRSTAEYYPVATRQLVGLLMCVFVRKAIISRVHSCAVATVATGAMGSLANKGAIGVSMQINSSRVVFINAHLAAGQAHCEKRTEDIATILNQLVLGTGSADGEAAAREGCPSSNACSSGLGGGGGGSAAADSRRSVFDAATSGIADAFTGVLGAVSSLAGDDAAAAAGGSSSNSGPSGLLPQDHDVVIVLGDLNYRVELPYEVAVPLAERGELQPLLAKDQLRKEMRNKHSPWRGFTDCTPTFPPTYRFDFGTSRYDTSEKRRIPAFTDRVLYWARDARHAKLVRAVSTTSFPGVMSSDHKPIRVQLCIPTKEVVAEERRRVLERLAEKVRAAGVDRVATAKTALSTSTLEFGLRRFWDFGARRTISVTNAGDCVSVVSVSRRAVDDVSGGTWMRVRPVKLSITPGETAEIVVECVLDRTSLSWLARMRPFQGRPSFNLTSLLVLSVESGPTHFVEASVSVIPSAFGNTLENLVAMRQIPAAHAYAASIAPEPPEVRRAQLPKEVWFLCDALHRRARHHEDLFLEAADHSELRAVMRHLDTTCEPLPDSPPVAAAATKRGDGGGGAGAAGEKGSNGSGLAGGGGECDRGSPDESGEMSVAAIAHALLTLLRELAIPVVPQSLQQAALAAGKVGGRAALNVVLQLPPVHCNTFLYIMSFLRFLLRPYHAASNKLEPEYLAQVFARVLVGPSTLAPASFKSAQEFRAALKAENEAAVGLVLAFLADSPPGAN